MKFIRKIFISTLILLLIVSSVISFAYEAKDNPNEMIPPYMNSQLDSELSINSENDKSEPTETTLSELFKNYDNYEYTDQILKMNITIKSRMFDTIDFYGPYDEVEDPYGDPLRFNYPDFSDKEGIDEYIWDNLESGDNITVIFEVVQKFNPNGDGSGIYLNYNLLGFADYDTGDITLDDYNKDNQSEDIEFIETTVEHILKTYESNELRFNDLSQNKLKLTLKVKSNRNSEVLFYGQDGTFEDSKGNPLYLGVSNSFDYSNELFNQWDGLVDGDIITVIVNADNTFNVHSQESYLKLYMVDLLDVKKINPPKEPEPVEISLKELYDVYSDGPSKIAFRELSRDDLKLTIKVHKVYDGYIELVLPDGSYSKIYYSYIYDELSQEDKDTLYSLNRNDDITVIVKAYRHLHVSTQETSLRFELKDIVN